MALRPVAVRFIELLAREIADELLAEDRPEIGARRDHCVERADCAEAEAPTTS
jgi:hypothetical protein